MIIQIQEEVAKTFKAEAQRDSMNRIKTTSKPSKMIAKSNLLVEEGEDMKLSQYLDDSFHDDENDDDDDFSDEEYEDEDDLLSGDDEEVMTQCPDYCKCAGQYAAATTATYVSNRIII